MFKILIAIFLVVVLTTSIYSQADARFGGFRGFGGGGLGGGNGFGGGLGKLFSSHSVPLGTGQGKMFTSSPSGKISSPQEPTQSASRQIGPSSSPSGYGNNPQQDFRYQQPSPFQTQPHSNFLGGGFGGFGGFGQMLMSSIMGNMIGQALFGWMFPHPAPVVVQHQAASTPATTTTTAAHKESNSTVNNNSTQKLNPIKK